MSSFRTAGVLVLALVAGLSLPGCFKAKQMLVLMPDGSGKMSFRIALNQKLIQDTMEGMGGMMGGGGGMMGGGGAPGGGFRMQDPTKVTLTDLTDDFEGFVAFTEPRREVGSDGWNEVTFDGYFADINRVKLYQGEGSARAVKAKFTFGPSEAGGHVLELSVVLSESDKRMLAMVENMGPEMEQMVMGMLLPMTEGLEIRQTYRLPGVIANATGLTSMEGREGTLRIGREDVKDLQSIKALTRKRSVRIECGVSEVSEQELRDFQLGMARAVLQWDRMKAGAERKAKEAKKAAEEEKEKAAEEAPAEKKPAEAKPGGGGEDK